MGASETRMKSFTGIPYRSIRKQTDRCIQCLPLESPSEFSTCNYFCFQVAEYDRCNTVLPSLLYSCKYRMFMHCLHSVHDKLAGKQRTSIHTTLQLPPWGSVLLTNQSRSTPQEILSLYCSQELATLTDPNPGESVHTLILYFLLVHLQLLPIYDLSYRNIEPHYSE